MASAVPEQMCMISGKPNPASSQDQTSAWPLFEKRSCFPLPSESLSESGSVTVSSARGSFIGTRTKRGLAFRGVPYARCQRFCLPQRIDDYGEVDCTKSGPKAPQPDITSATGILSLVSSRVFGRVPKKLPASMSENECLNLQIYLPEAHDDCKPLPVFFFVHGGLFLIGSNQDMQFQGKLGCKLATKQNMAVVLVNYRLGPFGFLKVPGGESNLGVHDVVAALRWVQEVGPSFGLDANCVTVAGQSAGAMLCGALLHVPSARGLFHRVIMMSGTPLNILPEKDADVMGERFSVLVDDIWKANPAELLVAGISMVGDYGMMPFQPCVDGCFLLENLCLTGLDILAGVTDNEARSFVPSWPLSNISMDQAEDVFEEGLGEYQLDCSSTAAERAEVIAEVQESYLVNKGNDVFRRLLSLLVFEAPFLASVRKLKDTSNVYVYRNMLGEGHGGELGFVFGTWDSNTVHRALSGLSVWNRLSAVAQGKAMESLWGDVLSTFVRTGTPSGQWPKYDDRNLAMGVDPEGLVEMPATAKAVDHMCNLVLRKNRSWGLTLPAPISKL